MSFLPLTTFLQVGVYLRNHISYKIICISDRCNWIFLGLPVRDEELQDVAMQSGVLDVPDDFLSREFRDECERIISVTDLTPKDCKDAFIFLKQNFQISNVQSV